MVSVSLFLLFLWCYQCVVGGGRVVVIVVFVSLFVRCGWCWPCCRSSCLCLLLFCAFFVDSDLALVLVVRAFCCLYSVVVVGGVVVVCVC